MLRLGQGVHFQTFFLNLIFFHIKNLVSNRILIKLHLILLPHYHLRTWGPDSSPEKRAAQDASYRFVTCLLVQAVSLLLSCWYKLLVGLLLFYTFTSCYFVTFLYFYKLLVCYFIILLQAISLQLSFTCTS